MKTYRVGVDSTHYCFDRNLAPCIKIDPGATVVFSTRESSCGSVARLFNIQDHPSCTEEFAAILSSAAGAGEAKKPWGHPLVGPVYINTAEPGDVLVVKIRKIAVGSWGWTSVRPGGGLLGDAAIGRAYHFWDLRPRRSAAFAPGIHVPLKPFCGILGVAPAEPGVHSTTEPRSSGGNMDIPQLTAGSTLLLPVSVPGALFSVGDVHAAQGEGEVSGSGIECDGTVTIQLGVRKGRAIANPQFWTRDPAAAQTGRGKSFAATGHNTNLYAAARAALHGVVTHLEEEFGLECSRACILASVCVNLHISQIVNGGVYSVTAFLPLSIFANSETRRVKECRTKRR